jgi:hypothetical protein
MRALMNVVIALPAVWTVTMTAPALAQTFSSGSSGADGAFTPTTNTTLTLPANGVFSFTTISIPSGVTVRFTRNAANTPVTLLATGNVTIAGTLDVSATNGGNVVDGTFLGSNAGVGGPGGFDGGSGANGVAATIGGTGLGPGGGGPGAGAGYAGAGGVVSPTGMPGAPYGNAELLPLIGGSGGGGGDAALGTTSAGGGGGGGAVLIASSATITLTGTINARGGSGGGGNNPGGGGSGGAIRLVATAITGANGTLDVRGGSGNSGIGIASGGGSVGRLRLEAYTNSALFNVNAVPPSVALPSAVALANGPTLTITAIGGVTTPAAPTASFSMPDITLPAAVPNPVTLTLSGTNIPPGTAVTVLVSGQTGGSTAVSTTLSGTMASTRATAAVTIPTNRPCVVSAFATFTPATAGVAPGAVAVAQRAASPVWITHGHGDVADSRPR